jgi:hypothetical protein
VTEFFYPVFTLRIRTFPAGTHYLARAREARKGETDDGSGIVLSSTAVDMLGKGK